MTKRQKARARARIRNETCGEPGHDASRPSHEATDCSTLTREEQEATVRRVVEECPNRGYMVGSPELQEALRRVGLTDVFNRMHREMQVAFEERMAKREEQRRLDDLEFVETVRAEVDRCRGDEDAIRRLLCSVDEGEPGRVLILQRLDELRARPPEGRPPNGQ